MAALCLAALIWEVPGKELALLESYNEGHARQVWLDGARATDGRLNLLF